MALFSTLHSNDALIVLLVLFNPISDALIKECFAMNSDIIIDNEFFAYAKSYSGNCSISVFSVQYMSCEKHVLISNEYCYKKWQTGSDIDLHRVYSQLIPNDQLDCLKYYTAKELENIDLDI